MLAALRGRIRPTLRGRLALIALIGSAAAIGVMVVAFNLVLRDALRRDVDSRLRSQAAAAATTLHVTPARITVRESPDDAAIDSEVWIFAGRRAVLRPSAERPEQRAADRLAGGDRRTVTIGDHEARLFAQPITFAGRRVGTVVTGRSLEAYDRTTDIALLSSLALALGLLAAVGVVTWLVLGRALAPVDAMTRSAREWSEHDPDRRFDVGLRDDELGRLGRTFDDLLDRVTSTLRREQRLTDELSHELRTPLSRIIAEMDLLSRRRRTPAEQAAAHMAVARSAEEMRRIVETLMRAARAEGEPSLHRSDVRPLLDDLGEAWAPACAARDVTLEVAPAEGPLYVGAEREVVERIIAPLLQNACRFASSRVRLRAESHGRRVRVVVWDDGTGLSDDEDERIFEPGVRGSRSTTHDGAGLGLALARRLARSAGGDVSAQRDHPDAGASFVVDLPG